jgi:aspartate kinase
MPGIVVMKFGGTSVADAPRLKRAAARIVAKREAGHRVVAVLSARGKETDRLLADAFEVSDDPDPRELDMLLSTGERVSCALCAMAINDLGHRAISLTGSQAGIVTDTSHTRARILEVRSDRIDAALDEDHIVLVAGFQGVSTDRDVTTLGRGGSDTTAVASSQPIRESCHPPASSTESASTRCSRWRRRVLGCCRCEASSTRAITACVFTAVRALMTAKAHS